jgi:hypothetical protein
VTNSAEAAALVTATAVAPSTGTVTAPAGPTALAGQVDMSSEIPAGFEEYVVVDAGIKCLTKEESDAGPLKAEKKLLVERIQSMARSRDAGEPSQVAERATVEEWPLW